MLLIFKIIGYLLLAVLLLLAWIILVPRNFRVEYCKQDGLSVKMYIGFFKVNIVPLPCFLQKDSDVKNTHTDESNNAQQEKKQNSASNLIKNIEFSSDVIKQILYAANGTVKRILKSLKFRDVSFTLPICGDDAYQIQQAYGKITAIFYTLNTVLQQFLQITYKSPVFVADFSGKHKDSTYFYCKITAVPVLLLAAGIYAFKNFRIILNSSKRKPTADIKED